VLCCQFQSQILSLRAFIALSTSIALGAFITLSAFIALGTNVALGAFITLSAFIALGTNIALSARLAVKALEAQKHVATWQRRRSGREKVADA
jgi:hypothetical protein